jgi:predicted GIY-YIG superfamily endonuclease
MGKPFYVYILMCVDGSYYTGHTDDIERRLAEHEAGGSCEFTSQRLPVRLVWYEEAQTREEAKDVEYQIKGWSRAKKAALIRGDVEALRTAARKRFKTREP